MSFKELDLMYFELEKQGYNIKKLSLEEATLIWRGRK